MFKFVNQLICVKVCSYRGNVSRFLIRKTLHIPSASASSFSLQTSSFRQFNLEKLGSSFSLSLDLRKCNKMVESIWISFHLTLLNARLSFRILVRWHNILAWERIENIQRDLFIQQRKTTHVQFWSWPRLFIISVYVSFMNAFLVTGCKFSVTRSGDFLAFFSGHTGCNNELLLLLVFDT